MKNRKSLLLKIAVIAVIVAVVCVIGYFQLFHNADLLTVTDGQINGMGSNWLTAYLDDRYVKIGEVSAPKGYTDAEEIPDDDGDPLTTQFAFTGKKPEKDPANFTVTAVPGMPGDFTDDETNAYIKSPYKGLMIHVAMSLPEDFDGDASQLLSSMKEKVVPCKKLSKTVEEFKSNFIVGDRWHYLLNGLLVTLEITFFAVLIGIVIGSVVASVRSTWDKNSDNMYPGFGKTVLSVFNKIANVYLTVIRGTPVVIQLMISYYVIFTSSRNGVLIAIIAFGINSGAYVAEIIRGGIVSLDAGQFEAGRSLGFNYLQTMWYIVLPQALKNVLPALANEFIVLLKETSVSGYVAVSDLTKGGDSIRALTYSAFMPLLAVAGIYLILVIFFTRLVDKLERRLRSSEH